MTDNSVSSGSARKPVSAAAVNGRSKAIILWIVRIVVALIFLGAGTQKLSGAHTMVVMFTKIGAGQWLRYAVGVLEIAGAVGLLIPRLCGLAAVGLTLLLVGATITNVFIINYNPLPPVLLLVLSALLGWGLWPATKALLAGSRAS
jgi:uncharacterized membrane protein